VSWRESYEASNTNFQGENTLRKLRGARNTLWDRESLVNRDISNGRSLVRTSEGSDIAAATEAAIYDEVSVQ
jgi:hypothetical protein